MRTANGIITLTTDFSTVDGYVGAIKGCLLTINPHAVLCDISHDLPPQDVLRGAWCLLRAVGGFPSGSVHLAVVDPEVGSQRRGVVVETANQHFLVGPDNGLLSVAAEKAGIARVITIDESLPWLGKSPTFDGLRLFAPVAAQLSLGMNPMEIGSEGDDLLLLPAGQPGVHDDMVEGRIIQFDHFGNGLTNIGRHHVGAHEIEKVYLQPSHEAQFCTHYQQLTEMGGLGALWNSDGYLELAYYRASLHERMQLDGGERVRVLLRH